MGAGDMVTPRSLNAGSEEAHASTKEAAEVAEPDRLESNAPESRPESPTADTPPSDTNNAKSTAPMQKRRRVTRACDECRRKKIKCDGKQPCTHCTVYSYECTYDQPSNRRRNPAPQYIEALEQRLQKAEAVLRTVMPGIDLDDPKFDAHSVQQLVDSSRANATLRQKEVPKAPEDDAQLQSMVDRTGALDLDDYGNWDFHGQSSGYVFMHKFRAQFGDKFLPESRIAAKNRSISQVLESPRSAHSSPYEVNLPVGVDLPPKEVAIELCRNTIDDCCALMRPIHRPTFFRRLHAVYEIDPEHYNNSHVQFLPLLYVVMAVGCLFSGKNENENVLDQRGYKEAMEQGYQYFTTAKQMLDITDCRDLITLQTILFMIVFLQSSAKLPTCYAYVGIALRACCRLGLHRTLPNKFNPIEAEERKRLFWLIRKMDSYVGAVLGLPQMLSDEEIDQEYPTEIDDDYILEDSIQPMPAGSFPLLKASNAHTRLTQILRKVVRYVYPLKGSEGTKSDRYSISHARIRELERDLQAWMDQLPMELRPSDNAGRELSRRLLRMSYAHVQMMMYRPFIHYVSQACQSNKVDKRSYACAAACISVSRNIVHITSEMKRRGLLVGSYWFVMYTTYFAILSLVFFVVENPNSPTGKDILKDAVEGRDTLASLAKRSMAADRCSVSLTGLFDVLPQKLNERRISINSHTTSSRKRPPPQSESGKIDHLPGGSTIGTPTNMRESVGTPIRARTMPQDFLAKLAKRSSMHDQTVSTSYGDGLAQRYNPQLMGLQSPSTASPMSSSFEQTPQWGNAQIPDLKKVMFPSDNPFAYPNQPISTLESGENQYSFSELGMEGLSGSGENSIFGTPTNTGASIHGSQLNSATSYDFSFQQALNEQPTLLQQFNPQSRPFSPSITEIQGQNPISDPIHFSGMAHVQEPMDIGDIPGIEGTESYWNDMNKFQMGVHGAGTGMGSNLEDLMGNDTWNSAWQDRHFNQ